MFNCWNFHGMFSALSLVINWLFGSSPMMTSVGNLCCCVLCLSHMSYKRPLMSAFAFIGTIILEKQFDILGQKLNHLINKT